MARFPGDLMRPLVSLIWLRWRTFINRWWLHNTLPNKIAGILFLGLLAFFSLIFGVGTFLAVVTIETSGNGRQFLWAFNQALFLFIFLTWPMIGLLKRDSSGVGQLRGYLFLPFNYGALSNFSLFSQLITVPATLFYPLVLGHFLGTMQAAHVILNSTRFWICAFELTLFLIATAITAEVFYNLVEQFLKKNAAVQLIVWVALLSVLAVVFASVHYPALRGAITTHLVDGARRLPTLPSRFLPPGLVGAELTRIVFQDTGNAQHTLVVLALLGFVLGGYRINAIVFRHLYLGNAGADSRAHPPATGGRKCGWWQWPFLSPSTAAIIHKELIYIGRSSLGKMSIGLFLLLSLGSRPLMTEFEKNLRQFHFLSSSASAELSLFLVLALNTSILLFYSTNYFGFDGNGLMLFFASPLRRRILLFGKNLAWWVIVEVCLAASVFISYASGGFRPVGNARMVFLAVQVYLLLSAIAGNFISIAFPQKLQVASLRLNSPGSSTPLLLLLIGWVVSALLGGLTLIVAQMYGLTLQRVILLGAGLASGCGYYQSLVWSERHLERNLDLLLRAIAFKH